MSPGEDEWGQDSSVRFMRRVFRQTEKDQERILAAMNVSSFDTRLRKWRESARETFEEAWPQALRQGLALAEVEAATLYAYCFVRALRLEGVSVPGEALPNDERLSRFLQEVLP